MSLLWCNVYCCCHFFKVNVTLTAAGKDVVHKVCCCCCLSEITLLIRKKINSVLTDRQQLHDLQFKVIFEIHYKL